MSIKLCRLTLTPSRSLALEQWYSILLQMKNCQREIAFQVLFVANFISIPSSHPSQKKLLAHKAGNNGLCIANKKSLTYCQVIEGKEDHLDRSQSYTQYIQLVFNNLHNFNNANERLFSTCLTIFPTIPPCCLTQTQK